MTAPTAAWVGVGASATGPPWATSARRRRIHSIVSVWASSRSAIRSATFGLVLGLGEHAGEDHAVPQLVLEGQVAEETLGERLGLLGGHLGERGDATDGVTEDVRGAAELTEGVLDAGRAGVGLAGVLLELTADLVTPGLGDTHPGDLRLGAGQAEKGDELVLEGLGCCA